MPVDSTGLTIPTVEEILTDLEAEQKATIDPTLVTEPEEPIGELNGIIVSRLREVYELVQTAYDAFNPDAVEGKLQDNLCAITGTFRLKAKKTEVDCEVDLDDNVLLPVGATAHITGQPTSRFTIIEEFQGGPADVYTVRFRAEEFGPIAVNAGTLTVIATPITGWNSITNPADASTAPNVMGRDEETPEALRARREEELFLPGSTTPDGLEADVLQVEGVEQCIVLENLTFSTDANGIPALSVETVIFDGLGAAADDNEIAQAIFESRAAGIRTYGSSSGIAIDMRGNEHEMFFSRFTILDLYLEFDLTVNDDYPGPATFKNTIVTQGQTYLNGGDDVIAERLKAVALSVPGVVDVLELRLDFSASPSNTANLPVGIRQIADLDTGRIVVAIP